MTMSFDSSLHMRAFMRESVLCATLDNQLKEGKHMFPLCLNLKLSSFRPICAAFANSEAYVNDNELQQFFAYACIYA